MKKFLLMLVVCASFSMTSCRWIHETFYPKEKCAMWYVDELHNAVVNKDEAKFRKRYIQFVEWRESLSESETEELNEFAVLNSKSTKLKQQAIKEFGEEHEVPGF